MAEENQLAVFEENTPPMPVHSQPPTMHAPPPLTPAGVLLALHGAPSTHLPPPASSGTPRRIQEHLFLKFHHRQCRCHSHPMITRHDQSTSRQHGHQMAELMALLKGLNRALSSSTLPPGYGPTVDPNPWFLSTFVQESGDAPALTTAHILATYPVSNLPVPPAFPQPVDALAVASFPPTVISGLSMSVPPPVSALALAPIFTVPPPTTHAPTHTTEHFPSQAPPSHVGFLYQAPPPINTTFP
ncbi:hypothetical protein CRG98_024656 [Punica granatum]|uniref:Extensin-like n=1 Tax=Punica granatum TaxID=22663 RepID=A0A2I0JFH2_PUNGR|nr:hypothetical protein CRG98_024656 [Punica granatum]